MKLNSKNVALLSLYILSQIPSIFYGWDNEWSLGIFIDRPTRIDWFISHYITALQYLIFAYCLKFPKNIDERIKTTVLIISLLDILDMIFFSGMFLSKTKIILGLLVGFRRGIYLFFKNKILIK